ncbi:MAG: hypothetical protein AAF726_17845 [Planctomycetota bacterium]
MKLAPLLLLFLLNASPSQDEGVVETTHPDGTVHERYEVDDAGRKQGTYERFRDDGSVEVTAAYKKDRLHGRYAEFDEDGALVVEALYGGGERNGYWRTFEDGVRTLNATYKNDLLHGRWESVSPDETHVVRAKYVRGVLDGKFEEERPEEKWQRSAAYKKGLLEGKAKITVARKTVSTRRWSKGLLVELDGRVPYPMQLDALRAELAEARVVAEPDADDPLSKDREFALMRLKTYRALCRLPWRDMFLVPEWNDLCDAASEVCEANGELSHTPEQPDGFDDERFRQGYEGASHSNLASGGLARSVDMYMDDSDSSNIDRVGHRRWCLNPSMGKTGFGASGKWAAMWSLDSSGPGTPGRDAVLYPPAGFVPVDLFGPRHAWSIQLLRGKAPNSDDDLQVEIVRLDEYYQPRGEPLELDYRAKGGGGFGGGPCVIFRPVDLQVRPGARYGAKVSLDGGKTIAFDYLVEFVAAAGDDSSRR